MALVDLGFGAAVSSRPSASLSRSPTREAIQGQRFTPARPKFCRINAGQLVRAFFLVLLCLGLSQISRAEKLPASGATMALSSKI